MPHAKKDPKSKEVSKKQKLLARFEQDNKRCFKKNETGFKKIDINRKAFDGYLPAENGDDIEWAEMLEEDTAPKKVITNIIKSSIQSYLPHVSAKNPKVSVRPSKRVQPVDGDETTDDGYKTLLALTETAQTLVNYSMGERRKLKKRSKKCIKMRYIDCASIMKVSFSKDWKEDPLVVQEIDSTQKKFIRAEAKHREYSEKGEEYNKLMASVMDGSYRSEDNDPARAEAFEEYTNTIKGLQESKNKLDSEGIALSVIPLKHFRWDSSLPIEEAVDGSFQAHYVYELASDVKAKYGIGDTEECKERIKKWSKFSNAGDKEKSKDEKDDKHVRVWERWDIRTGMVYTWVEGDNDFIKDPKTPDTLGNLFYPFFPLVSESSGDDTLPTSMVDDLIPLCRKYNDDIIAKDKHRKASIPFIAIDATQVDMDDLSVSVKDAGVLDIVGLNTNGKPLNQVMQPAPTVPLNPQLYDRSDVLFDTQSVTGLQDAERGAITKAKTLGEAQIAQQGLSTRTEDSRDSIEEWYSDIHEYALMLIMIHMTSEEVARIAGENATWAHSDGTVEQMFEVLSVDIESGSTGRPNKQMELKQWFENLENLSNTIAQVMKMRASGIDDKENPYYRMAEESFKRLDERIELTSILPKGEVTTTVELMQSINSDIEQLSQNPETQEIASIMGQALQKNEVVQKIMKQNEGLE